MMPRWALPIVAALMLGTSVSAQAATIQITMENLVISPRSPRAMMFSGSKCAPGVVAICVQSATQAALPSWREPSGAGCVFSMTQSSATSSRQRSRIVGEENLVETLQDRFGLHALGVVETAAAHYRLPLLSALYLY